jgi:hypothetical protein
MVSRLALGHSGGDMIVVDPLNSSRAFPNPNCYQGLTHSMRTGKQHAKPQQCPIWSN